MNIQSPLHNRPMLMVDFPQDPKSMEDQQYVDDITRIFNWFADTLGPENCSPFRNIHGDSTLGVILSDDMLQDICTCETHSGIWTEVLIMGECFDVDFYFIDDSRDVFRMVHDYDHPEAELMAIGSLIHQPNPLYSSQNWTWRTNRNHGCMELHWEVR